MPIYQYRCDKCHHELEALQKMSDPKLVDCPECSAPALRKQLTAAAFKLKGTGWYETDFKNSGKPAESGPADAGTGSKDKSIPKAEGGDASTATSKVAAAVAVGCDRLA